MKYVTFTWFLALLVVGCEDNRFQSSDDKPESTDTGPNRDRSDLTETIDEPEMVSGAFLTCVLSEQETLKNYLGCDMGFGQNLKVQGDVAPKKIQIKYEDGSRDFPNAESGGDQYHFRIPIKLQLIASIEANIEFEGQNYGAVFARYIDLEVPDREVESKTPPGGGENGDNGVGSENSFAQLVFVTARTFSAAEIGSQINADATCQTQAALAGFSGPFRALITGPQSVRNRVLIQYKLVNTIGEVILSNPAAIWQTGLEKPVMFDEYRKPVYGLVWSGSTGSGRFDNDSEYPGTCDSWTSISQQATGRMGSSDRAGRDWIRGVRKACSFPYGRLYCISQ